MITIGFDAKRAFQNFTGLGNYSRTLIETFAAAAPENDYVLFAPKPSNAPRVLDFLKNNPSVKTQFPTGFWKNAPSAWRSFGLKNDILQAKIQIFHGLSNELPLRLPPSVRSVVTIHDLIFERFPQFYPFFDRQIYRQKFRHACRVADVVVAISEQTKRDIVDFYNVDPSKIEVIYQSCHRQFSENQSERVTSNHLLTTKYNLPPNYIFYVGTVNERKNLLGVVEALKILSNRPEICLVAVGDGGAYFQKVKRFIAENHLESRVRLLPKVDFSDLPALYAAARVFVLPSFFEGFGIPIIEALWSGTPVISSVGSCFGEAGGINSIYINPTDSVELAAAIERVWFDDALRERMILRGRVFVEKFRAESIGQQWLNLYRRLI